MTLFLAAWLLALPLTAAWPQHDESPAGGANPSGGKGASSQTEPADGDSPQPAPPPPVEAVRALEILNEAAEVQGGAQILESLESFRASFKLEVFDPDSGRGNFEVERLFAYRDDEGIMWTRKKVDDAQAPYTELVYNGLDAWRIDAEGKVTVFTDRPSTFKTDINNIERDVRLTAQLFRFFFVRNLIGWAQNLRHLGEREIEGRTCAMIHGEARAWLGDREETRVRLEIAVDAETHVISQVKLRELIPAEEVQGLLGDGGQRRTFRFERYYRNSQNVLIPCRVKIYGRDESRHEMQLGLNSTVREVEGPDGRKVRKRRPRITFNVTILEKMFTIPE